MCGLNGCRVGIAALLTSLNLVPDPAAAQQLDEIIVTAQKRSQDIQSVPVSLTALSGETLLSFGDKTFQDYAVTVPNLSFGLGGRAGLTTSLVPTIRGVSGRGTTSVYIDDTPIPVSIDPRLANIDRIEVLRGPQGTLYGADAMGGTIRLITKQADPSRVSGRVALGGENVEGGGMGYSGDASVSMPIAGKAALLLSAFGDFRPGFLTRTYENPGAPGGVSTVDRIANQRSHGAFASLTITPADSISITPLAIYQNTTANGLQIADYYPENSVQQRLLNVAEGTRDEWTFTAVTVKYTPSFGTFLSSTSYLNRNTLDNEDGTAQLAHDFGVSPPLASPVPTYQSSRIVTQELRFASELKGPFQFVTGAFFQETNYRFSQFEYAVGINQQFNGTLGTDLAFGTTENLKTTKSALFADATFNVNSKLALTAGVRRARSEVSSADELSGFGFGGNVKASTSESDQVTQPRYVVTYHLTNDLLLYSDAAKGFRSGGANFAQPPICDPFVSALGFTPGQPIPFTSDDLWSYEIGAKSSWLSRKLIVNLAAYRIDWSKLEQLETLGCGNQITVNSGAAKIEGWELELSSRPMLGLQVSAALGYEDAKISAAAPGSTTFVGEPLNSVPKWTASVTTSYTVPIESGDLFVNGQYGYTGRSFSNVNDAVNPRLRRSYAILNLRGGITRANVEVAAFARNVTNKRANLSDYISEYGELIGRPQYVINVPRTVGLELVYKY